MNFPRVSFHIAQSRTLPPSQGLVNSVNITIETKACEVLENPTTGHRILTGRSRPVFPTVLTNINLRSSSPSDILLQLIRDQHLRFLYWHDNSHLRLYSYLALEISKAAIELGFGRNGFVMDIFYNVTYRTVVVSSDSLPRDESLSLKDLLLRMIDLGSDRFREETKSLKMETEPCSICLDDLVSGGSNSKHGVPTRMTCSHVFHDGCLLEWLERKNTCPLCRTVLYN